MSVRRIASEQPQTFEFTPENLAWAKQLIAKYPEDKQRSAVIPLLWRAQEQNEGWTSEPAMRTVADMLGMAYIRVYEVATFYTMFQLSPVGKKAHVQVCGTTPCMLRGAKDLIALCKRRIAENPHCVSKDGDFSWEEVECLGACVNAPMVQIFKDTYEDLDEASLEALLDAFANGQTPKPGPQIDRDHACPEGGLTSLIEVPDYVPLNLKSGAKSEAENPTFVKAGTAVLAKEAIKSSVDNSKAPLTNVSSGADEAVENTTTTTKQHEPKAAEFSKGQTKGERPLWLDGPRGGAEAKADDLKMIKGVGPTLEKKLNELGIYHFDQIANWTEDNINWVDEFLSFKGRINRENWLPQAKKLAAGEETEFSKRASYDDKPKGEA